MNSITSSLSRLNSLFRGSATVLILASSLAFLPSAALGQVVSFMKIEGIKGDSNVPGHRDEIEIVGFAMGVDRPLSPYAGGAETLGKPQFYEVRVTKKIDATSPLLFSACATGQSFPTVELSLSRVDPKGGAGAKKPFDFFKVVLSNVTITRVATGGSEESDKTGGTQDEALSLSFQKIEWIYSPESASGKQKADVKRSFDLSTLMLGAPLK